MTKSEYKAAASAYRARARAAYAITMRYESRPINADHFAEREEMLKALADLPQVAKPVGFDRNDGRIYGHGMAMVRKHLLARANVLRSELVRRANEVEELAKCGFFDRIMYSKTNEAIALELAEMLRRYRR